MSETIGKADFLEDLRSRNEEIYRRVEAEFVPLDRAARSTEPAPGEWSVDQCFQHLVLSFEAFLPQAIKVLGRAVKVQMTSLNLLGSPAADSTGSCSTQMQRPRLGQL